MTEITVIVSEGKFVNQMNHRRNRGGRSAAGNVAMIGKLQDVQAARIFVCFNLLQTIIYYEKRFCRTNLFCCSIITELMCLNHLLFRMNN
jgi:hypothetical protein